MASDGQILFNLSRFGDSSLYLRDFAKTELPVVAKIVKGQHLNLGVPSLSAPSLQSTALFLNAGKKYQIIAQPIKIKEGRKTSNVGPKLLIPESYTGFFELLSEDGRSTRCIENVLELSRRRNTRVLVRESVVIRSNNTTKTLHAGDIITTIIDDGKYLQCKTHKDEIINLPLEAKAKFSPIAKEDSISGVHSVKNLLQKRMPVIVRLVYGTGHKSLKNPFVPELRLLGCIEIDRIFALPLQKDSELISIPLNAKLKLQRAKNMEQLENFFEYNRFLEKAQRFLHDAKNCLQVIDLNLTEKETTNVYKKDNSVTSKYGQNLIGGHSLKKSASFDSTTKYSSVSSSGSIAEEYDEIDQIYDYVRGFAPLPKNLNKFEPINEPITTLQNISINKPPVLECYTNMIMMKSNQRMDKPIPPPIETIPTKKHPEKRQRNRESLPKLYVNTNIKSTNDSSHYKISSPLTIHKDVVEPASPLFHIRYKSLSSLQSATDLISPTIHSTTTTPIIAHLLKKCSSTGTTHANGTLDSSRSGGQTTSGESTSKLPEKKTRRNSRPRSLNLVWENLHLPSKDKLMTKKLYVHHHHHLEHTLYL